MKVRRRSEEGKEEKRRRKLVEKGKVEQEKAKQVEIWTEWKKDR
jgi:hypothetical protein